MCGFGLEGVVTGLTEKSEKTNGRVRQQTFTDGDEKVSSVIEKIREEESAVSAASVDEDDPLKAYLDDSDSADELQAQAEEKTEDTLDSDQNEDEDDDDELESILDDLDDDEDEDDELESVLDDLDDEDEEEISVVTSISQASSMGQGEVMQAVAAPEPRVIVEQGSKKTGGLSFGGAKQVTQPRTMESRNFDEGKSMEEAKPQRFENSRNDTKRAPMKAPTNSQTVSKQKDRAAPTGEEMVGRLYGWLVSFASSEGAAVEIREGRFFVTSQSMRDTDLVLTDPSVSSPHALMIVSASGGLIVQDLVSAQGVFVKASGERAYRREIDPVRLYHGDYLRIGNVEFLVSLLPDAR